jgi:hypothetical protein
MPNKQEQIDFSLEVERTAYTLRVTFLEAISYLCERDGLETEVVARLITGTLKSKLLVEAEALNLLKVKRSPKLPL